MALVGAALGADSFRAYPTVQLGRDPATLGVAVLVALSGLTPTRRV